MGSGNMVHNLKVMTWEDTAFDWAREFDEKLAKLIGDGNHQALISFKMLGQNAQLAIPTNEHFLPLLYILALQDPSDPLTFFCPKVTLGSISMRSFIIG